MHAITSRGALVAVVVALVALAARSALFARSPAVITGQVLAVCLALWARRSFPSGSFRVEAAPAGATVIRQGPYRFVRHPMYAAMLLFLWSGTCAHLSPVNVAIAGAASAIVLLRVVGEERLLRDRMPDYAEYARTTSALIPFVV